jgi:LPS-assembly lipoprotein
MLQTATPTISSQIETANAATVTVTATYALKRVGVGETMATGTATNATVYDRTEQRFANLRAQRDAEIKLAKSLADEIELRLAAYLGEKK